MMMLNGRNVLQNGTCLIRSRDSIRIEGPATIRINVREDTLIPGIGVTADGPGFLITISGFVAGTSMTSFATGNLSNGQPVVLLTWANRVSELQASAMYQLQYMIAEDAQP